MGIGHHPSPLSTVFLRLPPAQACPLLSVLPPRLSPELYLQLAVHIFDVTELPRLMCPRRRRSLPLVFLLRPSNPRG